MFKTTRKRPDGVIEVATCPLCKKRVEMIGAPMVRCYTTCRTYEPEDIVWVPETELPKGIEYDVENIRGNDAVQDFLPNAHTTKEDGEAA